MSVVGAGKKWTVYALTSAAHLANDVMWIRGESTFGLPLRFEAMQGEERRILGKIGQSDKGSRRQVAIFELSRL
jgi:hypothetical protein